GMVKKKQYSWHEVDAVLCLFRIIGDTHNLTT
ncbi:MAG: hypothetical protein ACI9JU_003102, partial [Pseudohongiellaceae bacterium]